MRRRAVRCSSLLAVAALCAAMPVSGGPAAAGPPGSDADLRFDPRPAARLDSSPGVAARGVASRSVLLDEVVADAAPQAQRRLVNAAVVQDVRASRLTVTGTFAAAPGATYPVAFYVYLGVVVGDQCSRRAAMAGDSISTSATGTFYGADENPSAPLAVTRSMSGTRITLTASDPAIASQAWECAYAASATTTSPVSAYTQLGAEYLDVQEAPELSIDPGEPLQGAPKGKWTTLRVDVRNAGEGVANDVRLRASGKGIKVKKATTSLGTIEDRSTKYGTNVKVKLTGARPSKLTLTATAAGGWSATTKVTIAHEARPKRLSSLVGRYWWGHEPVQYDQGWSNVALWFVSKSFVHVGFPKGAGQPRCTKVTKTCKRYTYDARTGKVKVGRKSGKADSAGLTLGRQGYYPLTLPKPGSKLSVALVHHDFSGYCGISCTTWTDRIFLTKKGRFTLTRMTIGSIGVPGSGTVVGIVPPDQTGRYKILSRGRIELRYDDGSRKVRTLGIEHDLRGKPNPRVAGVVLDDINFYWD